MFGIGKQNKNMVSVDVPSLVKQLVENIIGSLCEKFVTRADVDSIVLETVERVLATKAAINAVQSEEPKSETPKIEVVEETPPVKKPAPSIIGNPRKTHVD